MRNAETVLNIIRDRGLRKLPLEDVYRQLFNPDLYLRAYGRIYANEGAMTQGVTPETVDGMSLAKIDKIIEALRFERYRWTPVRRIDIPKKNGKTRPIGILTWSDKLLQEVMRSLLEAYYNPQFSDLSHGFRPGRGCHTALREVQRTWKGTKWFIEGDVKGCFDNIDHAVLLAILREKIHDNRFLRLVENLLKAGYCEQWSYKPTFSGTPQGAGVSPILANIYLDKLDQFVENTLIPENTQGRRRRKHAEYNRICGVIERDRKRERFDRLNELGKQLQQFPCLDPYDPDYRRLRYLRYADDFLLAFVGPKAEAEKIKERLATFLREQLKLELSVEKTLITHASKDQARFLGYDIVVQVPQTKHDHRGRRTVNGTIALRVPAAFVEERCKRYVRAGVVMHRVELINDSDFSIVAKYQSEYRGYVAYYALAQNLAWLNKVHWTLQTSLMKTLARKHDMSVSQVARRYKTTRQTPSGPRKCIQVTVQREGKEPLVAYFGALSLKRRLEAVLNDGPKLPQFRGTELLKRLLANTCELCGSERTESKIEVHHIRKLADLKVPGRKEKPLWMRTMASRKRKTLVLCLECHHDLHAGHPLVTVRKSE